MGHAQRRHRVLPDRRLVARPAGAEQRVHRRRAAVPRRHRQLEPGEDQQVAATRTACRSSRSERRPAQPASGTGRRGVRGRRMGRRASLGVRAPHHRHDADPHGRPGRRRRAAARPAPIPPAGACSARSTTAPWASRRGAPISRAKRTSTATSARPATQTAARDAATASRRRPGYLWHTTDKRFNADHEPNEPNRFGWVVEIDPFDPNSTPVKRTALGRFKHEGAWVQEARDGRVVVYMGDDEQLRVHLPLRLEAAVAQGARAGASTRWTTARCTSRKFHADGTGEWLPLTPDNPALAGWSLNDILINTRGGGRRWSARPRWIARSGSTRSRTR